MIYKRTTTHKELKQIIALQQKNLAKNLSEEEQKEQGFVTVEHRLETLITMHKAIPHIIAVENNRVIGYALAMHKSFKNDVPILVPMFSKIDTVLSPDTNYVVMGQICIDKSFRGKGVFRGLYLKMKDALKNHYDSIITEVDIKNTRSINAHKRIGFKTLLEYTSANQQWALIALSLK